MKKLSRLGVLLTSGILLSTNASLDTTTTHSSSDAYYTRSSRYPVRPSKRTGRKRHTTGYSRNHESSILSSARDDDDEITSDILLSSDFEALDFADNNDEEERILAALELLDDQDESVSSTTTSRERPHRKKRPSKEHKKKKTPADATAEESEREEPPQPRQWQSEPSLSRERIRTATTATPSFVYPRQSSDVASAQPQQTRPSQTLQQQQQRAPEPRLYSTTSTYNQSRPSPQNTTILQQQQASVAAATTVSRQTSSTTPLATTPWIQKFISSRPEDSLLPVPREYLSDGFNLVQLPPIVERVGMGITDSVNTPLPKESAGFPVYKAALRLILSEEVEPPPTAAVVERAAQALYTLVHARYVTSPRGLETVRRVVKTKAVFGKCPRVHCRGMPLLPFGDSPHYGHAKAKGYCPCCGERFYKWDSKVDGSAWGPSFCHLLLMTYGKELYADLQKLREESQVTTSTSSSSEASIFGFRIHPGSALAQRFNDG